MRLAGVEESDDVLDLERVGRERLPFGDGGPAGVEAGHRGGTQPAAAGVDSLTLTHGDTPPWVTPPAASTVRGHFYVGGGG